MALSLVSAPATEPLTIAEVKAHLKAGDSDGEPAPTGITVALSTGAGSVENGAHRYLATFVTADGETDAGLISAAATVLDKTVNGKVALSAIPIGGSAVIARNLYRTIAGGSTFLKLAQLADNTTAAYIDTLADSTLGVQAPTTNTTADPELVAWLMAARQLVETFTHRALITQTWDLQLDDFPGGFTEPIWVPKPPLQITPTPPVVTYVDTNGATQIWSASLYTVDAPAGPWARKGRLMPAYFQIWPIARNIENAVTVRFVAGYGAASAVPAPIKAAMKLLIGNWWINREAAVIARASADILPYGVDALLWPFKAF